MVNMEKNIGLFLQNYRANGIHAIKLKEILGLRSAESKFREIMTFFPPADIGSITLVDQITLLSLDEIVVPRSILEVGTFQGFTTRLFLKNSSARRVFTIDLPKLGSINDNIFDKERVLSDADHNDDYLRNVQNISGEIYLTNLTEDENSRLKIIKSDSLHLDFPEVIGKVEMGFIDGGHSYKHVLSDTVNLRKIIDRGVIVWHDFSSTIHSDVSRYLEEISDSRKIFWVIGGLCAFEFIGYE